MVEKGFLLIGVGLLIGKRIRIYYDGKLNIQQKPILLDRISFEKNSNEGIKVATKLGQRSDIFPNNYTEQALRDSVDTSRERLKTDCIDLLQLHCIPTEVLKKGEVFDWLRILKKE